MQKKFKPSHVTRNNVKGIARNLKCRKCEEHISNEKKDGKMIKIENILEEHSRMIKMMETDFRKIIIGLKEKILELSLEIESLKKINSSSIKSNIFE